MIQSMRYDCAIVSLQLVTFQNTDDRQNASSSRLEARITPKDYAYGCEGHKETNEQMIRLVLTCSKMRGRMFSLYSSTSTPCTKTSSEAA